jgi:hypothetical protein
MLDPKVEGELLLCAQARALQSQPSSTETWQHWTALVPGARGGIKNAFNPFDRALAQAIAQAFFVKVSWAHPISFHGKDDLVRAAIEACPKLFKKARAFAYETAGSGRWSPQHGAAAENFSNEIQRIVRTGSKLNPAMDAWISKRQANPEIVAAAPAAIDRDAILKIVEEALAEQTPEIDPNAVEKMVQEILVKKKILKTEISVKINEQPPKKLEDRPHQAFKGILELVRCRINVLMVGPSGCGKTFLAEQISKALDLNFGFVSCSFGLSEGALLGRLVPTGDHGKMEYWSSDFVSCYEKGGLFLFDEIDAADPNTLVVVNAALANGRLSLPSRPAKPQAKRHENFYCMAAANTFGHGADRVYAGRAQLDGATLDRFRAGTTFMDYDHKLEEDLVDPALLERARQLRLRITANGLRRFISTRFLLDSTKLLRAEVRNVDQMIEVYFQDWKIDEKAKVL